MEVLLMHEATDRTKHEQSVSVSHADAFTGWFALKALENDKRKASLFPPTDVACESDSDRESSPSRTTIVVVDDEPHIAITLAEILERRAYRAIWFTEPLAALEHMRAHRPDLLLTDVNMPMFDGLDLAHCLRTIHRDCAVLIVSANADDPGIKQRVAAAGTSVALEAKPVRICKLLARISELLTLQLESSPSIPNFSVAVELR